MNIYLKRQIFRRDLRIFVIAGVKGNSNTKTNVFNY